MDKINTLDFKMFDPVKAGEPWAVSFGSRHKVVEIYIDGKRLIDTIREIEYPYTKEEGCWSVTLHVKEEGQYVCWYNFEHEHRPWEYNLTYKFEKQAYKQALQKLKDMSLHEKM